MVRGDRVWNEELTRLLLFPSELISIADRKYWLIESGSIFKLNRSIALYLNPKSKIVQNCSSKKNQAKSTDSQNSDS